MANVDNEKREKAKAMLLLGAMSYRAIAREVGISDSTVRKLAKELGAVKVGDNSEVTEATINALAQVRAGARDKTIAQSPQITIQDLVIAEHLKNKLEFVRRSWQTLFEAQDLARQKIKVATVATEKFEPMLRELIELLRKNEIDAYSIKEILMMFGSLMNIPLNHISTFIGTQYDKMALAAGEGNGKGEMRTETKRLEDFL